MDLSIVLNKKHIISNLNIDSKKRVIEVLSALANDFSSENIEDEVFKAIYERERIGTTYLGKGVYMPHCKVKGLLMTGVIILILKKPYYDAQISDYTKIVVGVFFPDNDSKEHFQLLKKLAGFIKREDIFSKLSDNNDKSQLYDFLVDRFST